MRFSVGRTEVRVSIAVLPFLAFCVISGEWRPLLSALLSLAVHEAAHAITARNAGLFITRVSVHPFGAVMAADGAIAARDRIWLVAAAGPLGSVAFAALLKLGSAFAGGSEALKMLIRTNLLIAFFNLLPAFPLDGGQIFRAILTRTLRERTARSVLLTLTCVCAAGMLAAGLYLVLRGVPAWTLLAIPPFLIPAAVREWRLPDTGTVSRVMERSESLKNGSAQRARIVVVPDGITVGEALSALSAHRYTILRVHGETGDAELNEGQLVHAAAESGMQIPLKNIISRLTCE